MEIKRFLLLPLSFILLLNSCTLHHSLTTHGQAKTFADIDKILDDSLLQKGTTGIVILSASTGEVLYERNGYKYFTPASNMKIITTVGALFLLKPEYRFQTSILTNGTIKKDTIKGDITLYGKGDPSLQSDDLAQFAEFLHMKGVSTIEGDITFDDSYFDSIPYGSGWMWDDLPYPFSAPISALSCNNNTIRIYVTSGEKEGDSLRIEVFPNTSCITVNNRGITEEKENLSVTVHYSEEKLRVTLQGTLPPHCEKMYERSIERAGWFTAHIFKDKCIERGITISGAVRRKQGGGPIDTLLIHTSEPLLKILYDLDKFSSNFIAEHVLKTIGAEVNGSPGSFSKGINAIDTFLKTHDIITESIIQKDGSGLSRYNLISPRQITTLLFHMLHRFEYAPEFLTIFPIGGIDGTLRKRLENDILERRVRAKTGTMSNVSTLSGYCLTHSGKILIFSLMMKDYSVSLSSIRDIQDQILKKLIMEY